jgi:hypothetical protein
MNVFVLCRLAIHEAPGKGWRGLGSQPATAACADFLNAYPTFRAYFINNTYLPALGRTAPFP